MIKIWITNLFGQDKSLQHMEEVYLLPILILCQVQRMSTIRGHKMVFHLNQRISSINAYLSKTLMAKVLLASHLINCNIFKYLPPKREPEVVHSEGTGNELLQQKKLPKKKPIKTLMSTATKSKFCRLSKNRK